MFFCLTSSLPCPCLLPSFLPPCSYKVLDILQKVFYRSNPAREAFVEMCESDYVQKMTFDTYLYKTGEGGWEWIVCLFAMVVGCLRKHAKDC